METITATVKVPKDEIHGLVQACQAHGGKIIHREFDAANYQFICQVEVKTPGSLFDMGRYFSNFCALEETHLSKLNV